MEPTSEALIDLSPKDQFLNTLKEKIDDPIGQPIFVELWTAILKDCEVEEWREENKEEHTFRLILKSDYIAEGKIQSEETYLIEKEILLTLVPGSFEIIFPLVKSLEQKINPQEKKLNAIWGWSFRMGNTYTGVGYTQRWDKNKKTIYIDNKNDAAACFQIFATPQVDTLEATIKKWEDRPKKIHPVH